MKERSYKKKKKAFQSGVAEWNCSISQPSKCLQHLIHSVVIWTSLSPTGPQLKCDNSNDNILPHRVAMESKLIIEIFCVRFWHKGSMTQALVTTSPNTQESQTSFLCHTETVHRPP